ncbi:ArsR family transcriptional regulator [Leifsonia xyli subsp. cynodontis DSM 46306]|uniref:HTH arsR-type domain-containing protein n=1 Tax=Leifsonia xyli subsp. cynodontis DSM 46306 TaxID=1389489 RepID=U3P5J1_LEIXC|nr:winged helix-turn-helix domain-containing protein [Leifsonia xyli]AGW41580.1 ArsR family transcriptional regulator [Leifsonia xyli subsp. cynodontis DSM 46306]
MSDDEQAAWAHPAEREPHPEPLGMPALRALAHPLRVEIINELSDFGPATASQLAQRLGESSGATSYHLRQLAKHEVIVEDDERGKGRERWWKMPPGGISLGGAEALRTPAGREVTQQLAAGWQQNNERRLSAFVRRGLDTFGLEWMTAFFLSTSHLELSIDQLGELVVEHNKLMKRLKEKWKTEPADGRKRIQAQFNAFPLVEQEDEDR